MSQASTTTTALPRPNAQQQQPVGGTKVIIIALVLAAVAVIVNQVYIGMIKAQVTESYIELYKLNKTLEPGDKFNADKDVTSFRVPGSMNEGIEELRAVLGQAELQRKNGQTVQRRAPVNMVLTKDLFLEDATRQRLLSINDGYRQVALKVKSDATPGNLQPESDVDISAGFPTPEGTVRTLLIMEKVRVVAVGAVYKSGEDDTVQQGLRGYRSITIELPVEDAIALSNVDKVCSPFGPYEIMIRKPTDDERVIDHGTSKGRINPKVVEIVENQLKFKLYQ